VSPVQFISLSEYEAGFIALGARPIGILAIGMMPVGVVAVGIAPAGLISFACGAGLGVLSMSCGVALGGVARAVGLAVGADAAAVGSELALAGRRPEPEVRTRPTVSMTVALARDGPSWIEATVDGDASLEPLGVPVLLDDEARDQARRLRSHPVHARVRRREPPPPGPQGYRQPALDEPRALHCDKLEDAAPTLDRPAQLWYLARLLVVAALVLGGLGYQMRERLAIVAMNLAEVRWSGRVVSAAGVALPPGRRCEVRARLRSDGHERLHAKLTVSCQGAPVLLSRSVRSGCRLEQYPADEGTRYGLRCRLARVPRHRDTDDDDRPERPGLNLDTLSPKAQALVYAEGPPAVRVLVAIDNPSQPVTGPPLLPPGVQHLDAL